MADELRTALESVRRRIASACARVGRDPSGVALVAVSKNQPASRVTELVRCGHDLFGENRVQEALGKIPEVGSDARWHFVGHLQRNKARHVVGAFELLHSVDDVDLGRDLDRRARAAGAVQEVLVQVNLSREETKSGAALADLVSLLHELLAMPNLRVKGLMTIPPPVEDPEEARPWFRQLRSIRDEASGRLGASLPDLSMGMTDDFEVAIEEGATLIRVGRALFGERR